MVRLLIDLRGKSPFEFGGLACFDGIVEGRQAWEFDLDETLALRSAFEFAREEGLLDEAAIATLQMMDAFWRAHPAVFDAAFACEHRADKARVLEGFVANEAGQPVFPPPSHWWWRPSGKW